MYVHLFFALPISAALGFKIFSNVVLRVKSFAHPCYEVMHFLWFHFIYLGVFVLQSYVMMLKVFVGGREQTQLQLATGMHASSASLLCKID